MGDQISISKNILWEIKATAKKSSYSDPVVTSYKERYGLEFVFSLWACMGFSMYSSMNLWLISGSVHIGVNVSVVCLFMSALQ